MVFVISVASVKGNLVLIIPYGGEHSENITNKNKVTTSNTRNRVGELCFNFFLKERKKKCHKLRPRLDDDFFYIFFMPVLLSGPAF